MGGPRIEDLWEKEAYGPDGRHVGRIEAVAMGRDRVPRRVGVRADENGSALMFYSLTGVTLAGDRVILAIDPSLRVLPGSTP